MWGEKQGFQVPVKLSETPLKSTADISLNAANGKWLQGTGTARTELVAAFALCLHM